MPISTINTNSIADDVFQGNKNLIINGDMQCWQRATAATAANGGYATVDRFGMGNGTDGVYTTERSSDTPIGTGYSLKAQVTTADTSIAAAQYAYMYQEIEAQNLQPLQYGTSSAKTFTVSFWVKSNKTGTYTISIRKRDATIYFLPIEYAISSANTWEKKTITITPTAGGTSFITASAGAIANDNGQGIQLGFGLAWGSQYNGGTNNTWSASTHFSTSNQVNWMDSTSNNFYLAQVQLEIGDVATPFEHRSYADELLRCYRYFEKGGIVFANQLVISGQYAVTKRTAPTMVRTSNIYSASEAGTFGASNEYVYHVYSGSTYLGGNWTADAEL
jgi:hypothetical protein